MRIASFGVVVAVISAATIAGHLLSVDVLTNFGGATSMPLHVALALWLCGSGFIELALDAHLWSRPPPVLS